MRSDAGFFTEIIKNEMITTVFQPVFDFGNKTILGYEALSRGPENSVLESPEALFKLASVEQKISETRAIMS